MMRTYKRVSGHAKHSHSKIRAAVEAVLNGELKVPSAAEIFDIPRKSLYRYCQKVKKNDKGW